jgi:hypothetical protein
MFSFATDVEAEPRLGGAKDQKSAPPSPGVNINSRDSRGKQNSVRFCAICGVGKLFC